MSSQYFWCLTHGRVEAEGDRDDPDNTLGPYASEEEARNWKQRNEERETAWKAQDEAWDGEAGDDA